MTSTLVKHSDKKGRTEESKKDKFVVAPYSSLKPMQLMGEVALESIKDSRAGSPQHLIHS